VAQVINLRQARKSKARQDHEAKAAQNRATYGTPKAVLDQSRLTETLQTKRLDGHRLKRGDHEPD
jgi:hypothetical protein